jgi:acyl-CoA synthetase (AMP-forming)/AMP-acid ligase II
VARQLGRDGHVLRRFVDRPSSLAHVLQAQQLERPEQEALVESHRRWNWNELYRTSSEFGAWLVEAGVKPGDRVAMLLPNCAEFALCAWACWFVGAIVVPIDVREAPVGVAERLALAEPTALVVHEELQERVLEAASPRTTVVLGAERPFPAHPVRESNELPDETAIAALLFTSGTSGVLKAATLTHGNVIHSALHFQQAFALSEADRCAVVTPMSHVTGLVSHLAAMALCGGALVVLREFVVEGFLQQMARERISYVALVPAMYALLLLRGKLSADDLAAWRIGAFGGAPMPPHVVTGLRTRLPSLQLRNGYGATETCAPAVLMYAGDADLPPGAAGRPASCAEILVMDEAGTEVAAGVAGELWIRGPMVASGYWRNSPATAHAFVGGWWRSGDLGHKDANGYIHVVDRLGDVINRGGYKIPSVTVEHVLGSFPDVLEAAVVARPCPVLGQRVHAFVRASEPLPTESDLSNHCAARIAAYMLPDSYSLTTDPLPRNAAGKVQKSSLRAALTDAAALIDADRGY